MKYDRIIKPNWIWYSFMRVGHEWTSGGMALRSPLGVLDLE